MKTLKTLQQDYNGYKPKAGDEQKFKDKHVVKHSHKLSKATDDDDMFKAANVKVASRDPGHGYNAGEDEAVYEEKITHDVKAHTKAWLSGSDAPMDDDMGNYNKMHRLAKSHLSGGKVPAKDHDDLADKMVDHAELGEEKSNDEFETTDSRYDRKGKLLHRISIENESINHPAAKKTLGEMMEAMKLKDPVGVELHFTSNDPELKPYRVIHFTAKNAHDEEKRAPKGYKVKRKLVYGKESA